MRAAKSLSNAFVHKVLNRLYLDAGGHQSTVFIAGTGRSGTTWLEDIINFENDHRVLFEPFHSKQVPLVAHWNYRQYLRPNESAGRYLDPARKILSGRIRNGWVDQFNSKHLVTKRLVKDIRANLILRWIHEQFPEIPLVLLLRHPCAVASSKLALGWRTHLEDFTSQPELIEDHLQPFLPVLASARDEFDCHILLWCVENWIPLRQFAPGELHVCFYEHFCTQPEREARALTSFLHRDYNPSLLSQLAKPSALSKTHSAILNGDSVLDAWRKRLDPSRIDRALELMRPFGLDRIYGAESLPKIAGSEALKLFAAPFLAEPASAPTVPGFQRVSTLT